MKLRAYSLPIVMAMSLLLATALSAVLIATAGSVSVGEALLHRRQAFHAAEGVSVAALELASRKLRDLPLRPAVPETDPGYASALASLLASNEAATEAFLNDASTLALLTPKGYQVGFIDVAGLGAPVMKELDAGPFAGMLAQVQPLSLIVSVKRVHDRTPAVQRIVTQVERATISMFQFYVFSDVYLDLDPGGPVDATGRIHTNGDFCVAGQPKIDTVTAAGDILMSNRDGHRCRRRATEKNNIQVATDDDFTAFATLDRDHDHSTWAAYARSTFHGHVLDSAHGITPLRMPVSGRPPVQAGSNVLAQERVPSLTDNSLLVPIAEAKEDNTTSMRFLVDPMLRSEPSDAKQQKFAFLADIRIIDGVWFLRDPDNPTAIGTPIWSDHPGSGSTSYVGNQDHIIVNQTIGQEDLRTQHGWGSGNTPQRFSYYGFEPDPGHPGQLQWARANENPRAVISYGLLHNAGSNVWNPGHYTTVPTESSAGATGNASTLAHFLDGARSGFKDGWLEVRSETVESASNGQTTVESNRARMLPINFDVAAFIDALRTCAPGQKELGSFFPGTCTNGNGRTFNGIVYISATWPDSMHGLGTTFASSDFAKLAPFHGTDGPTAAADPGLPMPLCFPSTGPAPVVTGAPPLLPITTPTQTLTPCGEMGRGVAEKRSFPNIVRIFNAQHISPLSPTSYAGVTIPAKFFPKGLTIATNLAVVAMGDMNIDTTPKKRRNAVVPPDDHFAPFLIAGDRFYRFSRGWQDHLANWVQLMNANARIAEETTQNLEILAGWNPTPSTPLQGHDHSSDGFEDFPRYLEKWNCDGISRKAHTFGSIVVAFSSVYTRSGANNGDGDMRPPGTQPFATCFPARDEGYDFHLEDPANQPPGSPQILAQSTSFWQAR